MGPLHGPHPIRSRGNILFGVGSILYSIAAFVSALKAAGTPGSDERSLLRRRTAIATASLYELGGVCFIVGTLGYVPPGTIGISKCPEGASAPRPHRTPPVWHHWTHFGSP